MVLNEEVTDPLVFLDEERNVTNNEAEYEALIQVLKLALRSSIRQADVYDDS
ncbi:hypothetical protein ACLOJK_008705 [Asimina triloba]